MSESTVNNKRIAKNTLVLYVRMLFLMAINLYTSRVILQALGVEDFGIYNVIGGFVALFAVLSQSLSSAASRFLTFEMGKGNKKKLARVFSTTLIIHFLLALVIVLLSEIIGIWFVNNKMVIAPDRLEAANWVFQFSVITFCFNLITVPHNAAIIAHEKMSAFAYISIFEGIGMLIICYFVMISPIDRLILYGFLILLIKTSSRFMFYIYCKRHFEECHFHLIYDKTLMKEIFGFASWNMIGSSAVILRNQGGNVLINLFDGPVVNAARAIANQVFHAVNGFVQNFFMALRPQITKSYAKGDMEYMMSLVYQGSRISYYMLLILCMPILTNTEYLLHLWLKNVPDHTVLFVQLTLVFALIESVSYTLVTAQLATGKVRNYQLIVGGLQMMNLPVSYVILKLGGVPETILYVAIFFSISCLFARLIMLKTNIHLNVMDFMVKVIVNIVAVTCVAATVPCVVSLTINKSTMWSFILITFLSVLSSFISILYVGCTKNERFYVHSKVTRYICGLIKK